MWQLEEEIDNALVDVQLHCGSPLRRPATVWPALLFGSPCSDLLHGDGVEI
jgi:hypothetical protein